MAHFLVKLVDTMGQTRTDGVKGAIVDADTAAIARALVAGQYPGYGDWAGATVTDLASLVAADLSGYRYEITISGLNPGDPDVVSVSHTGAAAATVDTVGTALAVALNAHALIAGAAYVGATNVLTISAIADNLGDRSVGVAVYAPGSGVPVTGLYDTIVHNGIVGAALTVHLVDMTVIGKVLATV